MTKQNVLSSNLRVLIANQEYSVHHDHIWAVMCSLIMVVVSRISCRGLNVMFLVGIIYPNKTSLMEV